MSPKEAMLMLVIHGLIDNFAKDKALKTVESLFKKDSCVSELCKMATKFLNENSKELNLPNRIPIVKQEPMGELTNEFMEQDENLMEVDAPRNVPQPVYYADDMLHLILKGFENEKVDSNFVFRNFLFFQIAICKQALSACASVLLQAPVCDRALFDRCVEEIRV